MIRAYLTNEETQNRVCYNCIIIILTKILFSSVANSNIGIFWAWSIHLCEIRSSTIRFGCCQQGFICICKINLCKSFYCFKVFGTVHGLPALFCIGAAPSIYYIIASFWIPNTPFYLLKQGNQNKAEFVLERLREPNKARLYLLRI